MKTWCERTEELRVYISDMLIESAGIITPAIADTQCTLWFSEAQNQEEEMD